jgi:hypothetical protein
MTTARPTNYIANLLQRLIGQCPVTLVVGNTDTDYLQSYARLPGIAMEVPSQSAWKSFKAVANGKHQLASWTLWRALQVAAKHAKHCEYAVIFEDDVIPKAHWEIALKGLIKALTEVHGSAFILSLYRAGLRPPALGQRSIGYGRYPINSFFGTQAMCYPMAVLPRLIDYIYRMSIAAYNNPYDIVVGRFTQEMNIPLIFSVPSLVQHIGTQTTGLGTFHQSGYTLSQDHLKQ